MFQDLDEAVWADAGGLAAHPVIGTLLGGNVETGAAMFAEEHDIDSPEVAEKVPLLALDADASQHSAIYDAMSGRNLVIEGPPGTGKSQTITNIIAAALANGKRVLFMADKQAALRVVKDRLDNVGLGDFCLELHSGKARKKDMLDTLARRLGRAGGPIETAALDARLRELAATRTALTRYVATLNAPCGGFGATVHDILWADRRRRDGEGEAARRLDALTVAAAETLSCRRWTSTPSRARPATWRTRSNTWSRRPANWAPKESPWARPSATRNRSRPRSRNCRSPPGFARTGSARSPRPISATPRDNS
jgi:hypothetical protein